MGLPRALSAARTRFERWRTSRVSRTIPEEFWSAAAELAEEHGVHQTSRALRLNDDSLKKRVDAGGASVTKLGVAEEAPRAPVFVDVVPDVVPDFGIDGASGGVAELQDGRGARMRIEWRGPAPDFAAAASALFGSRS